MVVVLDWQLTSHSPVVRTPGLVVLYTQHATLHPSPIRQGTSHISANQRVSPSSANNNMRQLSIVLCQMGMRRHVLHATGPAFPAVQRVEHLVKLDNLVADLHQGKLVQAGTTSRVARTAAPCRLIKSCTVSSPYFKSSYSACNTKRFLYIGCPTKLSQYDNLYFEGREVRGWREG